VTSAADWAANHLPARGIPAATWPDVPLEPAHVAVGLAGAPQGGAFALEASHLRRVIWHNATLDCFGNPCIDAGGPRTASTSGLFTVSLYSYVDVAAHGGHLAGHGIALAAAGGGPNLDLAVAGKLRLPEAHLIGACPKGPCPDPAGKTFLATGNLTLADLAVDPSNKARLGASLSGNFQDAAFDEAPTDAFALPGLWIGATAGLALVAALAKLASSLWAGFSRRSRPPALDHPRRQAIFDLVREEPGHSFRGIQRNLGVPVGVLQKHIKRLEEAGVVISRRHRNTVRYFENDELHKRTWMGTTLLRDADAQQLHHWLLANPGPSQVALARQTASWGWTLAKTRRRLDLLEEGGLLVIKREGRRVFYHATAVMSARAWPVEGPGTVAT
jgi:predicted transcriptional regulator